MTSGTTHERVTDALARYDETRQRVFASPLHDEALAARLGVLLGISFTVCFLTGLVSHLVQDPPAWFVWPARPAGLYRVTQGVHVAAGVASVPLLLAKLWVVIPHFYAPPPRRLLAAVERLALLPLVAGSLFLLLSGVGNIQRWRPWGFSFTVGHWWAAWIAVGGLVIHIGAKITQTLELIGPRGRAASGAGDGAAGHVLEPATRRGFLAAVLAAAGGLTLASVGQTFSPLARISVLAPRRPGVGPQGIPVNKSAVGAGVVDDATSPTYRLRVVGAVQRELELSVDELRAMPQTTARLPIACVEGWSAEGTWTGVAVRDLLERAGAADDAECIVESLQARSLYRTSPLNGSQAHDRHTLLALDLGDEPLHIDHGFPVRLIGPNRPGVQQTKWVSTLRVLPPGATAGDAR